jgi:hypothetical protein
MNTRPLTANECAFRDEALSQLRAHFHQWSDMGFSEHGLIEFAIYEGCLGTVCCQEILNKTAAFALAKELADVDGFEWVMMEIQTGWHYAIYHTKLNDPIDLTLLDSGKWNRKQYDEAPDRVEVITDSYEALSEAVAAINS